MYDLHSMLNSWMLTSFKPGSMSWSVIMTEKTLRIMIFHCVHKSAALATVTCALKEDTINAKGSSIIFCDYNSTITVQKNDRGIDLLLEGLLNKSLVSVERHLPNLLRKQSVTRKYIPYVEVSLWISAQLNLLVHEVYIRVVQSANPWY